MKGYIYRVTNTVNGKSYVGRTIQRRPRDRWAAHKSDTKRGSSMLLHRAMRKYGVENFTFEIILELEGTKCEIAKEETRLIRFEGTLSPRGYNALETDPWLEWTERDRQVARERMLRISNTPERREISRLAGQANRGQSRNGLLIGVYPCGGRFASEICNDCQSVFLGSFKTEKEAGIAYDIKARELWGDRAKTNFKESYEMPKKLPNRQNLNSEIRGVGYCNTKGKWRSRVAIHSLKIDLHLGFFESETLAAKKVCQFWVIFNSLLLCQPFSSLPSAPETPRCKTDSLSDTIHK